MKTPPFWPHGAQTKLAQACGVSAQQINDLLHRRANCSPAFGHRLFVASVKLVHKRVINYAVSPQDWVFNKESTHPAFFGEPLKARR